MPAPRSPFAIASIVLISCVVGCDAGPDRVEMVKLAGSVQLDGQPVKSGTISFIPSDGKNPATGGTIADGHYQAQVPLGPMQISISSPQVTGVQKAYDTPDSPLLEISEEMIPAIYNANTTLEHTVSAAKDDLNFDLKSTP